MQRKPLSALSRQKTKKRSQPLAAWLPFGLIGLGALVLIGLLVVLLNRSKTQSQSIAPARIGAPLVDFTLPDIQGQQVSLSDFQGQVVLVNTWATWCPPCRAEMPDLNAYYQAHQKEGFVILAINAGESQSIAAAFAQEYRLAFPVLLDSDYRLLNGLAIHDYPTSIVIGRDGLVKTIHIGMYRPEQLEADIIPLLSQ